MFLYIDCDEINGDKNAPIYGEIVGAKIEKEGKIKVKVVKQAKNLSNLFLHPFVAKSVIIFMTDVIPLSTDKKLNDNIEKKLENYCRKGGILMLSHDAIYRRSRLTKLQEVLGGVATKFFQTSEPVKYTRFDDKNNHRYYDNKEILTNLPHSFSLNDREYLSGKWDSSVDFLYFTESPNSKNIIPLITKRNYVKGHAIWLNSGDTNASGPCPSLAKPNENLCKVLATLISKL